MNVLVVSDYGLTDTDHLTPLPLDKLLDMDQIQYIILSSGYASVIPYALTYQKAIILFEFELVFSDLKTICGSIDCVFF